MNIADIAFTIIPVSSLKLARPFYESVLGLTATKAYLNEGEGMVEYDIGPTTIALGTTNELFKPSKEGCAVAFEVVDFDVAVADLKKIGATFHLEPYDTPVCRMAVVSDPDGNKLMIHKRKA